MGTATPQEQPQFKARITKDGRVLVYWQGRLITTLTGSMAAKFADLEQRGSQDEAQLFLAKATGNFKRGNER